ncbi:hypothetical protein CRI94_13045 [Longibacter salinarum]|uniref:FAD/NAD(P)-binding domain-containing protein n=1 Tax=Longibacter salinarum TaxID=1850348 RepID=A0A2A8CWC6_9BACT|nr:FAD/NAD(P)-binding oxidoreductase [Longibacter salinarum]PEN12923.1 hypothetical protein CRI94_13045 [Longibacter salinarum]
MSSNRSDTVNRVEEVRERTWRFDVVILGGGEAGASVARALSVSSYTGRVALVEPSSYVYDQPGWIRVATSGERKEATRYHLKVPPGTTWIRRRAEGIDPDRGLVELDGNESISYEHLVVAAGIETRWDRIRGIGPNMDADGLCSVYGYEHAEHAWDVIRTFQGGRAIFTASSSPYKGGQAPYEVLRNAVDVWRNRGVLSSTELIFATAWAEAFSGVDDVDLDISDAQDTHVYRGYDLVEVRPDLKEAVFTVEKGASQSQDVVRYSLLHIAPPMRPPAVVENSILAYSVGPMTGFMEVDPETLQHPKYPSVFGVGDVTGLRSLKTGRMARQQAKRVVQAICR